jgi:hypothetical protein
MVKPFSKRLKKNAEGLSLSSAPTLPNLEYKKTKFFAHFALVKYR